VIDRLLIAALRLYKRWISPLLGQRCRFVPTCSEYAMGAVERHGALRGSWLTVWRLARCQPLHPGGFDPVPELGGPWGCRCGCRTDTSAPASPPHDPETPTP
jgi:hypothetical protein